MSEELKGIAANPPGYIDELGQKNEWTLEGEVVWHRIDGCAHSCQSVQGFLDYGVAELLYRERRRARSNPAASPGVEGEDEAVEVLAKIEHDQWMHWAKSILTSEAISMERKTRWFECMKPYYELSEEQKEHDRVWARKVLSTLAHRSLGNDENLRLREALQVYANPDWYQGYQAILVDGGTTARAALQTSGESDV